MAIVITDFTPKIYTGSSASVIGSGLGTTPGVTLNGVYCAPNFAVDSQVQFNVPSDESLAFPVHDQDITLSIVVGAETVNRTVKWYAPPVSVADSPDKSFLYYLAEI